MSILGAQRRRRVPLTDGVPQDPQHESGAARRHEVDAYFAATASYWEDIYGREDVYSAIYRDRLATVLAMVDRLRLPRDARCLDVGCGPGLATVALARRGYPVEAIDTIPVMLERTRDRAARAEVSELVSTRLRDLHALDLPERSIDLVLLVGVSEWLSELAGPLAAIARVLKPGGHLVVTADNRWALPSLLDPMLNPALAPLRRSLRGCLARFGWAPRRSMGSTAYSMRAFDAALAAAGLVTIQRTTVGFGPFTFLKRDVLPEMLRVALHRRLQSAAARGVPLIRSAGFVYVAAARKADSAR